MDPQLADVCVCSRGRIQGGGDSCTALRILPDKLKTELALHVNLATLKKVKKLFFFIFYMAFHEDFLFQQKKMAPTLPIVLRLPPVDDVARDMSLYKKKAKESDVAEPVEWPSMVTSWIFADALFVFFGFFFVFFCFVFFSSSLETDPKRRNRFGDAHSSSERPSLIFSLLFCSRLLIFFCPALCFALLCFSFHFICCFSSSSSSSPPPPPSILEGPFENGRRADVDRWRRRNGRPLPIDGFDDGKRFDRRVRVSVPLPTRNGHSVETGSAHFRFHFHFHFHSPHYQHGGPEEKRGAEALAETCTTSTSTSISTSISTFPKTKTMPL